MFARGVGMAREWPCLIGTTSPLARIACAHPNTLFLLMAELLPALHAGFHLLGRE